MAYKFKTEPWEHQLAALDFLMPRSIAALYTDMGTGKSKIMIDMLINKGYALTLICCTHKGCGVWVEQFRRHSDLPSDCVIDLSKYSTKDKVVQLQRALLERNLNSSGRTLVLICNYEGVWRKDLANFFMRKRVKIDCIICDESHRIKSPSS